MTMPNLPDVPMPEPSGSCFHSDVPRVYSAEEMRSYAEQCVQTALPGREAWDGKLPDRLQRGLNALRLECPPLVCDDLEHIVRMAFEAMWTTNATLKHMLRAAQEAASPPPTPPAQAMVPLTEERQGKVIMMMNILHSNVPEDKRPMSTSDFSDEQWQRAVAAWMYAAHGITAARSVGEVDRG